MTERKRVLLLVLVMGTSSLVGTTVATVLLYRAAFEEERSRLVENAQSEARLIEAVARFDASIAPDYPGGPAAATLSQIRDFHERYEGFGRTGEFTLARRTGDTIDFLLRHRHVSVDRPLAIPLDSELAEPMRRALSGLSGTVVGLDYRGEIVLAAHEPVAELDLGIVAKIDLAEIRAPFLRAGLLAEALALLVVLAGAVVLLRLSTPMVHRLEQLSRHQEKMIEELRDSEERFRATFEQAAVGIAHSTPKGQFIRVNRQFSEIMGYASEELLARRFQELSHPEDREADDGLRRRLLAGEIDSYSLVRRFVRRDQKNVWGNLTVSLVKGGLGDPKYLIAVVEDITERQQAAAALSASLKEKEVLLKEIHHRVKNNLQLVASMLNLQSDAVQDGSLKDSLRESQSRIKSLALVHEKLYGAQDLARVSFKTYCDDLASFLFRSQQVDPELVSLRLDDTDVSFDIDAAIPVGLILNELISNSLKHGFPDGRTGEINIGLHPRLPRRCTLIVADNGVGFPADLDFRKTDTLGLQLVCTLTTQIGGSIELDRTNGTRFTIEFEATPQEEPLP
jgi:PAS domain S-box-containing protein